jgi:hydrogenase nickel incorporation protein HypA/HybF
MHEMSLCESIVGVLEEQASAQDYRRVKKVWLEVGELAGVEIEALRFGFEVVTRGTLAEGARLEIVECLPCARTVPAHRRFDPCPLCSGYQLQVTGGEELRIKELEVE